MTTTILAGLAMTAVGLVLWYGYHTLLASRRKSVMAGGPAALGTPGPGQAQAVASEPPPAGPAPSPGPNHTMEVSGLTKAQAEELLDWLEANGYHACELSAWTPNGYTVRYQ